MLDQDLGVKKCGNEFILASYGRLRFSFWYFTLLASHSPCFFFSSPAVGWDCWRLLHSSWVFDAYRWWRILSSRRGVWCKERSWKSHGICQGKFNPTQLLVDFFSPWIMSCYIWWSCRCYNISCVRIFLSLLVFPQHTCLMHDVAYGWCCMHVYACRPCCAAPRPSLCLIMDNPRAFV